MTAVAPTAPAPASARRPARIRSVSMEDLRELGASAAAGIALTWLVFFRLTHWRGATGFLVCAYLGATAIYAIVSYRLHGRVVAGDRLASIVVATAAVCIFGPLVLIVGYTLTRGARFLSWSFFTETLQSTGPLALPTAGGALHSIVGTLQQVALATVASVPLGILAAVYLNELGGRLARPVRTIAEALTALPSIVAGLVVYSFWVLRAGAGFSGFAGSLALAILMLPTVVIASEQALRVVPGGLREAALALGAPMWRVVLLVVLPSARSGLIAGSILAVARAAGETAPLILTTFGSKVLNTNPFEGAQDSLPLFIFSQVRSAQDNSVNRGWAGAVVLLGLTLVMFALARAASRLQPGWSSRFRRTRTKPDPSTRQGAR